MEDEHERGKGSSASVLQSFPPRKRFFTNCLQEEIKNWFFYFYEIFLNSIFYAERFRAKERSAVDHRNLCVKRLKIQCRFPHFWLRNWVPRYVWSIDRFSRDDHRWHEITSKIVSFVCYQQITCETFFHS